MGLSLPLVSERLSLAGLRPVPQPRIKEKECAFAGSFPGHHKEPCATSITVPPSESRCRVLPWCRLAHERSSAASALAAGSDQLRLQSRVQLLDDEFQGQYMIGVLSDPSLIPHLA